ELRTIYTYSEPHDVRPQELMNVETITPSADPWNPCHVFRAFSDRVERSDSSGSGFATVEEGAEGDGQTPVVFGEPDRGHLSPQEGRTSLQGYDRGSPWAGGRTGIAPTPNPVLAAGQNPPYGLVDLEFAPSAPWIGYALVVVSDSGATLLYGTVNGGD